MITTDKQQQRLIQHFSFLQDASATFLKDFFNAATLIHAPQGHTIATEGAECAQLALVLEGKVRVYKLADSGREITLYRIHQGDSCILTASCIMSHSFFPAIAEAETDLEAIIIPAALARNWISQHPSWCRFVFGLVSKRLAEVISVLESVAFQRMDSRIAHYLLERAKQESTTLATTHHEIASDLGTSREVVSRMLKEFDKRGLVNVSRGVLVLRDLIHLKEISSRH